MLQLNFDRWRRGLLMAAALTVGLVAVADWLLYRQRLGWSLGLYLLAVIGALLIRPAAGGTGSARAASALLAALLLGLAGAMVIEPTAPAVLLASLGVIVLASTRRSGWQASVAEWAARLGSFAVRAVARPVRDMTLCHRWLARRPGRLGRIGLRSVAAWGVPVVLSAVFIGLFRLANPVLDLWSHQLGGWIGDLAAWWFDHLSILRILFWVAFAVAAWSLMRVRSRQRRRRSAGLIAIRADDRIRNWGATAMVVRCLVLFNMVFAGQLLLDARYLLGGAALPEGLTYAEYAHRGAYPLMATALLAGAFVLVTFRAKGPAEQSATARRLVYLWIAQNLVLLASAAWRLRMYVDVYSLTMWRIAAAIWMLLVAAGLVWIVARIVYSRSNVWLLRANLLTALVVLYACCFLNFASWIAWFNVMHCREVSDEGAPIDLAYLERLGPEALAATRWLAEQTRGQDAAAAADDIAQRLQSRLNSQLSNWRGWTLRKHAILAESRRYHGS